MASAETSPAGDAGGGERGNVGPSAAGEDPSKKIRKPYTITKSRESWTEQEHDKFLEALQLFDRDWKKIEAFVGSKTVIQIRSHAQKYFLKVQKNGTSAHVPPPRPKRKAAHPYPQKAPRNAPAPPAPLQTSALNQTSSSQNEPEFTARIDSPSVLKSFNSGAAAPTWAHASLPPLKPPTSMPKDVGVAGVAMANNCCSSTESPTRTWPAVESVDRGHHAPSRRAMPDFAQVYNFIGSVFDPNVGGHLEKLKEMDPIDVETVLLLMRNLSVNLTSPEFETHRRLLSSYNIDEDEDMLDDTDDAL